MDQEQTGPTLQELHQAFLDGGQEKVGLLMTRADGKKMVPSPKDLFLAWQFGGRELLGALMSNMDGNELDDSGPEFDERRWR
jgi:hypothetical protein